MKKRLILNTMATLIIIGVAILAGLSYASSAKSIDGVELPSLSALKFVDGAVDLKKGVIQIALEIPGGVTSEGVTKDVIAVYKWGRNHFQPIKCGPEYPPEMCRVGAVIIFLLRRSEVLTTEGVKEGYDIVIEMGLDQKQIDKLLALDSPLMDFSALRDFHSKVQTDTQGTGGFIEPVSPGTPFTGFKP